MMRNERGFTIIELILVMVVLAIMAAIAIPKFIDIRGDAKKSAVQGSLGGVRSAIGNYRATQIAKSLTPETPTLASLIDGTTVVDGPVPDNPYSTDATKNDVTSTTLAKGTVGCTSPVTSGADWCYNASSGEFWAATNVASENTY